MLILSFILTIVILVFVHEFGHYFSARLCGVYVEEFAIGFGKNLFSFTDKIGTVWRLRAIPLGGFVRLLQDDKKNYVSGFNDTHILKRMLIVVSGPLFNLIFTLLILTACYMNYGKYFVPAVVGEVVINSPAENSGIIKNDKIIQINGIKTEDFSSLQQIVSVNPHQTVKIKLQRSDTIKNISVSLDSVTYTHDNEKLKIGFLGIKPIEHFDYKKFNFPTALKEAGHDLHKIAHMTFVTVKQMIIGQRSTNELRGMATVALQARQSLQNSFINFLIFLALMSANLGIINMLPIPILDGGQFVYLLYEAITGRAPSPSAQSISAKIGVAFVIFLVVISTSNDIRSILKF